MKIAIIGATGTIGKNIYDLFTKEGHDVIAASYSKGDYKLDIGDRDSIRAFFQKVGKVDAVVNATGNVSFSDLENMSQEEWYVGLDHKLMGQVSLVQEGLPFINDGGSFTLISGILNEVFIKGGVSASMVNSAIEGFVKAVSCELPRGVRINVVSPTMLEESESKYRDFFPGIIPVPGKKVAQAFKRSVLGVETGNIFKVFE